MNIDITRRGVVGACILGGALLAAGVMPGARETAQADEEGGAVRKQYGFWVDTVRCDNCGECVKACREAHQCEEGDPSRRTILSLYDDFGNVRYASTSCMHCSVPSCESVCPAGAIKKRSEDGLVCVDQDRCIGCKYCYQACPFAVPRYTEKGMDKCDGCASLGEAPKCVEACKRGALHYGEISELVEKTGGRARAIEASTGPNCLFS